MGSLATFLVLVVVALLGGGTYMFARYLARRALLESIETKLFLVRIPKPKGDNQPNTDYKNEVNIFEQFISRLSSFRRPFTCEAAVHHIGEEIHFYIAVHRGYADHVIKTIHGLWNNASISEVSSDYNIFNPEGSAVAAWLQQAEHFALPIRTYSNLETDPLFPFLGGFAKIREVGEGAAIQVILRPAASNVKAKIQHYLRALRQGVPLPRALRATSPPGLREVSVALSPKRLQEEEEKKQQGVDEEAIKLLEEKIAKPLFEVNVRVVASAPTAREAQDILEGLTGSFGQFAAPTRNGLKVVVPRNQRTLINAFIFRKFSRRQTMLLNSEEIASLYHFPTSFTEAPKVKWLKAKEAPPPPVLPTEGVLIGENIFRGAAEPVYITDKDRERHVYIIGQTGTGKSTLMGNMIVDDIHRGKGVAIIDPHGEFCEYALAHIPKERIEDVIYFDPGDTTRPLGLNMLEWDPSRPEEKTFIVNEMLGIFRKLFAEETMGPMFEQYMRNALLLLMEDAPNEPATLIEVPRIFTDAAYRKRKIARVRNPVVIDFWEKEAEKAGGEASLANMTPYITSKFNNFIANDYIRPIIGQPKSAFNFRKVMDEGKILLINLSKGKIGDINAGLLGMIFTGKFLMAALSRVDIPQEQRRPFYLFIDEFQNFATASIPTVLSEARKYRLSLVMAHQFIAQLTEETRDAIFGNVGSSIVFRVGVQDAEFLVKQFEPVFDINDLLNIDNYHAYVRLLIHGQPAPPFNIATFPPQLEGNDRMAREMQELSRLKYGVPRDRVEQSIYERLRS